MKKNLVFMTSIGFPESMPYAEFSFRSWRWWCRKHDVSLYIWRENPNVSPSLKPTWLRYSMFDVLDRQGIEYHQAALVDADTIIRWDCPDFFSSTEGQLTVTRDNKKPVWISASIEGYAPFFPGIVLDLEKYFNAGFFIVNQDHRPLFQDMLRFHESHRARLEELEERSLKRGTDQTPLNYLVQERKISKKYLPEVYNLMHFIPQFYFAHNGAFIERIPFAAYINRAYIWHFNGFPKKFAHSVMRRMWDLIKDRYT